MIVCHCNKISAGDIENAVCCLKSKCATDKICPESVYGELKACPNCCGCFPLAEKVIRQAEVKFFAAARLTTKQPISTVTLNQTASGEAR